MVYLTLHIIEILLLTSILWFLRKALKFRPELASTEPPRRVKMVTTPEGTFALKELREPKAYTDEELWEREHGFS